MTLPSEAKSTADSKLKLELARFCRCFPYHFQPLPPSCFYFLSLLSGSTLPCSFFLSPLTSSPPSPPPAGPISHNIYPGTVRGLLSAASAKLSLSSLIVPMGRMSLQRGYLWWQSFGHGSQLTKGCCLLATVLKEGQHGSNSKFQTS